MPDTVKIELTKPQVIVLKHLLQAHIATKKQSSIISKRILMKLQAHDEWSVQSSRNWADS